MMMDGEESPLLNNGSRAVANHGYGAAPSSPISRLSQTTSTPLTPPALALAAIDTSDRIPIEAMAVAEVILHDRKIRRESSLSVMQRKSAATDDGNGLPGGTSVIPEAPPEMKLPSMLSPEAGQSIQKQTKVEEKSILEKITSQLPAIAIASVLNFMAGIPFGASYFPTELPLAGKEVLGLRMFLFSTMLAQLVFTYKSNFVNCVGLQMVENVPFYLELARIVIDEQGTGIGASSTLFFLFGLSSVIVGLLFYLLGKLELGRVVYFFPSHVLVGCIGGIGVFIATTSLEVTTNATFSFTAEGFNDCIFQNIHLLGPVIAFELLLRLLMRVTEKKGEARFPLLCPVYYCCITPVFYAMLWCLGISESSAEEAGYFFPRLSSSGSAFDADLFSIFTEIHADSICWKAVIKAIPTIISLAAFSLLHVPINVPAFAISTNVEPDMNTELIAHGYSNALAGIFGGLQNYMGYANSVIYSKSSGQGKLSSLAVVAVTIMMFIFGPTIASYVPRCMAGTLLLHVGIDLFLEAVAESYHDYDRLEYSGILLITVVMVVFGMGGGLIAGVVAALTTYAAQSIVYQDPIRGQISGARLRSSAWNRCYEAQQILLDRNKGRQRIHVIQLQGHIFFGNVTRLTDRVKRDLNEKRRAGDEPLVVILDFTHVIHLDSSAAQSIARLKSFLLKKFDIEILLFVTGHEDGFRCKYDLSGKIVTGRTSIVMADHPTIDLEHSLSVTAERALHASSNYVESKRSLIAEIPNSRVCETLDDGLLFAEDVLLALEDPDVLHKDSKVVLFPCIGTASGNKDEAKSLLETLCPEASGSDIDTLYELFSPEKYNSGDIVWEQGDSSTSLKLVVEGTLTSLREDEQGTSDLINPGSTIGELGLVNGGHRLTTVKVLSNEAILYSLDKEKWESLTQQNPQVARFIYLLVIRYLAHRVQRVSSNNILDVRTLPV